MESKVYKAVETLCEELAKDKSEGSYYYSWQANIAMSFQDEFWRTVEKEDKNIYGNIEVPLVQKIANEAAKNFLNLLIDK
jgi:hypothetical protein